MQDDIKEATSAPLAPVTLGCSSKRPLNRCVPTAAHLMA